MRPHLLIAVCLSFTSLVNAQTDPGPYPSTDRENARSWFNQWWPKTHALTDMGFTGDFTTGDKGSVSQAWQDQTLLRINLFRRMVQIGPISVDPTVSQKAQLVAFVQAANPSKEGHYIDATYKFYSEEARLDFLNCSLTNGFVGSNAVAAYLIDWGLGNEGIGHRDALLDETAKSIGLGDAPTANSLVTVKDLSLTAPNAFDAWPFPGYVPHHLIVGRWSISSSSWMDFKNTTLTVTRNDGLSMILHIIDQESIGLVWTLDGTSEGYGTNGSAGMMMTSWQGEQSLWGTYDPTRDVTYHVAITGIMDNRNVRDTIVGNKIVRTGAPFPWNGDGKLEYDVIGFNETVPTPGPRTPSSAKLINISTRAFVGTGSDVMIAGLVVGGTGPKTVLIRASGPALTGLGVDGALVDPVIELHDATHILATNDNWSDDPAAADVIAVDSAATGAFPWVRGSKDAAMVATLSPGSYSVVVSGKNNTTGVALIEAYEVGKSSSKLVNISTRSLVKTGSNVQIAGFVIGGTQNKTVLIRASGPALTRLGVSGALADPIIELHDAKNIIATNDNWSADSVAATDIELTSNATGAFAWERGSNDAGMVLNLPPGAYSALVKGAGETSGVALIEIYEAN